MVSAVTVTYDGHIEVEAETAAEALKLAKEKYIGVEAVEMPCIDTDFAYGDDIENVEPIEEEG